MSRKFSLFHCDLQAHACWTSRVPGYGFFIWSEPWSLYLHKADWVCLIIVLENLLPYFDPSTSIFTCPLFHYWMENDVSWMLVEIMFVFVDLGPYLLAACPFHNIIFFGFPTMFLWIFSFWCTCWYSLRPGVINLLSLEFMHYIAKIWYIIC